MLYEKRLDGRYETTVRVDGKTKHIYGETQKEVKQKVAELKISLGLGMDVTQDMRLSFWIDQYINNDKSTEDNHNTKKARLSPFKDRLGNLPIEQIKPSQIESILQGIAQCNPNTGKPSSQKTIKEYKNTISSVFRFGIKNRVIVYNPCDSVELKFGTEGKQRRALTYDEIALVESAPGYESFIGTFAIYTGLRRGEMAALDWSCVDLDNRTIRVERSYNYHSKTTKSPKTKYSVRQVPLNQKVVDLLSSVPKSKRKGFVINTDGKMLTEYEWEKYLCELLYWVDGQKSQRLHRSEDVQKLLSIQPFDWHCLRHTFATLLYDKDVPVKVAQKWLGHSSMQTTMNIYTHLSKEKESKSFDLWI